MITDGIIEAVNLIGDIFRDYEENEIQAEAVGSVYEMLLDYNEDEWYKMSYEEQKEWVSKYLPQQ